MANMWIDGRRAVRPDREYYRDVRRKHLRSSRSRRNFSVAGVAVALVVLVVLAAWFMFR